MDGFTRFLFTVVPIRLFSWALAVVFLIFAVRIARKTVSSKPTLTISDAGLGLPDGRILAWREITSAKPMQETHLEITLEPVASGDRSSSNDAGRKSGRSEVSSERPIALSVFDLGAARSQVAAAITSAINSRTDRA